MAHNQLESILDRLARLEAVSASSMDMDLSDPPLILFEADGTRANPEAIERIPDLVKELPLFCGDSRELNVWLNDAEGLVELYRTNANSTIDECNKYHMVCKTIRRKIRNEANDALVASNIGINWNCIKRTLQTYYGEKRDLTTLDYQLMNSQQKGRPLEIYYDDVNRLLSLIANHIKTDPKYTHPEASAAMIDMYNKKAIDSFVRGLDGDVGKFLKNYEPDSLAVAYSYCISFQNTEYRKNITRAKIPELPQGPRNQIPIIPPRLPPRQPIRQQFPPHRFNNNHNYWRPHWNGNQNQFHGRQYFAPRPQHNPFNQPAIPPRRPVDRPEPMDVDRSLHSRQVNYGNRPQNSHQNRPPLKRARMFHISPRQKATERDVMQYTQAHEDMIDRNPTFERYMKDHDIHENSQQTNDDNVEFNFLE